MRAVDKNETTDSLSKEVSTGESRTKYTYATTEMLVVVQFKNFMAIIIHLSHVKWIP
jgi:hypothetical protein